MIGDIIGAFLKYLGTVLLLCAILIFAIMVKYNVDLDFVFNGSDEEILSAIEAELDEFKDLEKIKYEIIDALPFEVVDWLSNFEFIKDIVTVVDFSDIGEEDPELELYKGLAFGLFVFLVSKIVIFCYRILRSIANRIGTGFISLITGGVCFILIAYFIPVSCIMLRDWAIDKFYDQSPILLFVVYAAAIIVLWCIEVLWGKLRGIKGKENLGKEISNLVKDAFFSVSCLWACLSVTTLMIMSKDSSLSDGTMVVVAVNATISLLLITMLGAVRFSHK